MSGPVDVLAVLRKASHSVPNDDFVAFDDAFAAVAELTAALRIAVRQNSHDMLMTGEELRICESALARVGGAK